MSARSLHRTRRAGKRGAQRDAAQSARYRSTLAAVADLDVPAPRPEHALTTRQTRRVVRRMLRTGHLIGEAA